MLVVEKRDASTIMPIIFRNVTNESSINSNELRADGRLSKHGYRHNTVNHKVNFVNPQTGEHTQLIECMWLISK